MVWPLIPVKTYECAYCGEEYPYKMIAYNYTLKARVCDKCSEEIKTRDEK